MPISNKYTRPSRKRLYDLSHHLKTTDNPRLRAKVSKLVKIIPDKYHCEVVFTKRRIWFIKTSKRIIQLTVEKRRVLLKIRTNQGWHEFKLPEWQNFTWLLDILEKQTVMRDL